MPSIRAYLTALFVIPLALATGVVAFVAQRIARNAVEQYAVSILQSDAQGKREAILAMLDRQHTAGAHYLETAEANCGISGMWNPVCAREALEVFTAQERAKCAVLQTTRVTMAAHRCQMSPTASDSDDVSFTPTGSSYVVTARNSAFASVLFAEYSSEDLYRILAGGEFGVTNSGLFLRRPGKLLAAPTSPHFVTPLDCSSTHAQDRNGRPSMVRSVAMPELGGCVISHIPERQALASSLEMRRTSWLMVTDFILAALLLAYGAATLMSRPLARLTDRAMLLQEGDFDASVPIAGPS